MSKRTGFRWLTVLLIVAGVYGLASAWAVKCQYIGWPQVVPEGSWRYWRIIGVYVPWYWFPAAVCVFLGFGATVTKSGTLRMGPPMYGELWFAICSAFVSVVITLAIVMIGLLLFKGWKRFSMWRGAVARAKR